MAMNSDSSKDVTTNLPFHKRFGVDLEIEHAQEAFVNRILDGIEEKLRYLEFTDFFLYLLREYRQSNFNGSPPLFRGG